MSVLIIGAGIAGISCGYNLDVLTSGSIDLQILEARSEVGGRTRNVEASFIDFDIDMGGQDLFFADQDAYQSLLTNGENFDYTSVSWARDDVDFLDCQESRGRFNCENENLFRGDLADASFGGASLATFINDNLLPRVEDSVSLNKVVTNIDYTNPNKVVATTRDGSTYEADKLVVAVPLSQLKKETIRFNPPLPRSVTRTIDDSNILTGVRIWVEFSERFYEDVTRVDDIAYWDAARGKTTYCSDAWENEGQNCNRREDRTSCNVNRNSHYCRCSGPPTSVFSVDDTKVCRSTTGTLEAIVDTNGGSCSSWCAGLGAFCTAAWENEGDNCSVQEDPTSCGVSRNTHYCRCEAPSLGVYVDDAQRICRSNSNRLDAIVDTDGESCNNWCADLNTKNIITIQGVNNGDMAEMSDIEIRNKVLRDLDIAYDGKATETYLNFFVKNWKDEDFIEMTNINRRDFPDSLDVYLQPVDGRIWFAGDYTRFGNENQAGISGIEVAEFIHDTL